MKKLEDKFKKDGGEFREYLLHSDKLFTIVGTKSLDEGKLTFTDDGINFIGRISENNGIKGKISYQGFEPNSKNTITATVIGNYKYVKFQEEPYYCSQNINKLIPNFDINRYIAMYLVSNIQKFVSKYNGQQEGYKLEELKNHKILLPTKDNQIDFAYMEERIHVLEEERIHVLEEERIHVLENYLKVSELEDCTLTEDEQKALDSVKNGDIKFKKFNIEQLFTCETGDVDIQRKHVNNKGDVYINSGVTNCGIIGKTDFPAKVFAANTITVDMFGNAYYRDFKYKMATHAHVFSLTHKSDVNAQIGLYFCGAMNYFKQCYSFSNMCNWTKMKLMSVILPTTSTDNIDYAFIDTYIKAIEKKVIQNVIAWKDKEIEKAKDIIINTDSD